jgi:hypothetical protein
MSEAADFDAAGRLVTTSFDGFVRLYAPGHFDSLSKKSPPLNERLFRIAFSPDGKQIAVGMRSNPSFESCRLLISGRSTPRI